MVKAIPDAVLNSRAHASFTETLRQDHADDLREWQNQVEAWEQGRSEFCPYTMSEQSKLSRSISLSDSQGYTEVSIEKIKQQLADEEHERELAGNNTPASTAAGVISEGIDIEEAQCVYVSSLIVKA